MTEVEKLIINILENRGWFHNSKWQLGLLFTKHGYVIEAIVKNEFIIDFYFGIERLSIDLYNKNSIEKLHQFIARIAQHKGL